MRIDTFTLGQWMTNCYVVSDEISNVCWIVDAGFDPGPMLDAIDAAGLTPTQVLLTHAHVDHIAGLHAVRHRFPGIPILIHDAERAFLTDASLNLSMYLDEPFVGPDATGSLAHGQTLTLGDAPGSAPGSVTFEVRHTPGHSPGNVCLYAAPGPATSGGVAIVGDTLFAGSVGRTDFPTSNPRDLIDSIRTQLLTLPDATRVLPGHGPATTIGRERASNPFLG